MQSFLTHSSKRSKTAMGVGTKEMLYNAAQSKCNQLKTNKEALQSFYSNLKAELKTGTLFAYTTQNPIAAEITVNANDDPAIVNVPVNNSTQKTDNQEPASNNNQELTSNSNNQELTSNNQEPACNSNNQELTSNNNQEPKPSTGSTLKAPAQLIIIIIDQEIVSLTEKLTAHK